MPAAVALLVVLDDALAVATAGDDGCCTGVASQDTQAVSVVAFIAEQVAHIPSTFEERGRGLHVADVAWRQHQRIGTADDIGERVDPFDKLRTGLVVQPPRERPIACAARPPLPRRPRAVP